MANFMLTTKCNFNCDYCFGMEMIGPGHPSQTMAWDLFLNLLDWIGRADVPGLDIHLMGGEPTLSPLFGNMICELKRRNRKTVVFSNLAAPIDDDVLLEANRIGVKWVVNVNHPSTYIGQQAEMLTRHLEILGSSASLTFNITSETADFDYVFDYIGKFSLNRQIKIGITLPTLNHKNTYVNKGNFPVISVIAINLITKAQDNGIDVEFECGVPYCLFSAEQHEKLKGIRISHCRSRLDITPTGNVINCLPLCQVASIPYSSFSHYREATKWFNKALDPYTSIGSDEACLSCKHILGRRCQACLAHTMWQLNRIALPPIPSEEKKRTPL